ncbi:phage tail spike protein [Clostridium perfringens]|uniref:phage tail spike protein n=1 Tax=Clostridium perfringens TaxID=1502 RepID=UPI001D0F9CC6|nr:phage tail spike protein [Clostridium perfringens]MCC2764571.1 NlpC/P60 family protein [Clostridium perfringens]MCG4541222.1 NlpC/P60 family protein [Clostridium perfringens]MCG4544396.1 NlpC/P60 family protein [Clostridium perfringens]MCG4552261.1 NlpC/P60 family protein [Clostridium perfringens]MCG4558242.1 NlpC/P60 family protein [Clostridium perfringens]
MQYYKSSNTNFNKNGDITLQLNTGTLRVELNTGINEIEFEIPYDKQKRWKKVNEWGVVKCKVFYSKNRQLYRIYNVTKGMFGLKCSARHIFFDLIKHTILDNRAVATNGQRALDIILDGTNFKGHSDIEKIATAYFVKLNAIQAINGDKENSFRNRWGGEMLYDNFDIYVNTRIGKDNGIRIKYKRNMEDVSLTVDRDSIITKGCPVAYDGKMLPEKYICSQLINKYPIVCEGFIDVSDLKLKDPENQDDEGFDTEEELYNAMRERMVYLYNNGLDKPKVSGSVKLANLANTIDYKDFKNLERVGIGDTVTIDHEEIGIDIKTRCIVIEWDLVTEEIINTEFGDVEVNYFDKQEIANGKLENILNNNGTVNPSKMEGIIDALQTKFKALRDVAQPQHVLGMLFEDKIKGSKTYGAMAIGSMGFMIASERTEDDKDWDWRTFGSGQGFFADWLVGNLMTVLITNKDKSFEMDLRKSGGMTFKNNGIKSMLIENNALKMFNYKIDGQYIGGLISLILGSDENKPLVGLTNSINSAINIGYEKEGDSTKVPPYMQLDKFNILKDDFGKAIRIWEDIDCKLHNIYNVFLRSMNDKNWIRVSDEELALNFGDNYFLFKNGKWTLKGDLVLDGVIKNTNGNLVLDPNAPQGGGVDGSDSLRNSVVNSARKLIGKPYVWGGNYPPLGSDAGTDCSGLMQWAYNDNGIKISRTTYTQIKEGIEVSEAELKPGDLIFLRFSSPGVPEHVFMYSGKTGDGKHMCVEAPRTGLNIREIEFTWGSNYRARRIIKDTQGGNVNGTAGTKASKNIIYYVKGIEGYAPYHYYDSVGVKTLGYGMTGNELNGVSVPLSETSATHYLVNNFNRDYYIPVLNIVKSKGVSNPLQREIDAFASFAYNCGVEGFRNSQLLNRYVNGERGEGIHNEFMKWIHAGSSVSNGLIRRREEEWKIFSGSSSPVGGYNTATSISYINKAGLPTSKLVTENGGYGASPY